MKRLLLLLCMVLVVGCSKQVKVEDISVEELKNSITAYENLGMAFESDLEYLDPALGIDETELSEFTILMGPTINATRIVIFEVEDKNNVEKYVNIANELRNQVIASFETYLPAPYEVALKSHVEQRGNYVIFIAHHEEEEVWKIVDTFIPAEAAKDVTAE